MLLKTSSFCRICAASCGVIVSTENGRLTEIKPDPDNQMTRGFACYKGLQSAATHNSPKRLLRALKRSDSGEFLPISIEGALDEIAEKLGQIVERHGANAIATYLGGPAFFFAPVNPMAIAFRKALGTDADYSSITIDQPAKAIVAERLGIWGAGKQRLEGSDVLMLIGANPLISCQAIGCINVDPIKTLKQAKERGLKLIVIDPRRTETARYADVFLQSLPGEDPTVLAGLVRVILAEGLEDRDFCSQHVRAGHIERLRGAVEGFTPEYVAGRAGIAAGDLVAAARLFANGKRGAAFSATGPSMSPRSTLSEHFVEVLNVICGRFVRAGEVARDIVPWLPLSPRHAQVIGPTRSWERYPNNRFRGVHSLAIYGGQKLTCNLADEILTPGEGQIRCVLNDGGAMASAIPNQRKVVQALRSLELLVTIEPFMTNTARLSHYVFAPRLQYEHADLPLGYPGQSFNPVPWAQYQPEIAKAPAGSELVEDWYVFWGLAKRLGLQLTFAGAKLGMDVAPTTDDLLRYICDNSAVRLETIKQYRNGGKIFDVFLVVESAQPDAGRFELIPDDVANDLAAVAAETYDPERVCSNGKSFRFRLAVRRMRDMLNSQGLFVEAIRARNTVNPAWLNVGDLESLSLKSGDRVWVISDHDRIEAIAQADTSVRRGVVMMSHSWGGLPDEKGESLEHLGSCTNLLINSDRDFDPLTAQARMSAIPVNIERIDLIATGDVEEDAGSPRVGYG
jgi:anaerobic selenocysteine-containing dehydrogenase